MKNTIHFEPGNLRDMWRRWLLPLKYGELGFVMTYPGSDYPRRVLQLSQESDWLINEVGAVGKDIKVGDYRVERWHSTNEFRDWLNGNVDVLILLGLETLLTERRVDLVKELQGLYRGGTKILLFSDKNIFDIEFENIRGQLLGWQPRTIYFDVYKENDVKKFIEYLQIKWELDISSDKVSNIISQSGGILAFVKELIWQERTGEIDNTQLNWQVKSMWDGLTISGKDYLRRIVFGREVSSVSLVTKQYFEKIGWVLNEKLQILVLYEYVKNNEIDPIVLKMESEKVIINGQDYSSYFSHLQSKILQKMLDRRGQIISRDDLVNGVWGPEGTSDWAFDSQIKRLRDRLDELGVGGKHLTTKRGRGIGWRE